MTEWHTLDSDNLPPLPAAAPARFSFGRRGFTAASVVVLILAIGWGLAQIRLSQRREVIRSELSRVILAEEAARFRGDQAEIEALIHPAAPSPWQQAYRRTFATRPLQPPGLIQIDEVEFDSECATLTALITGVAQVRAYCLNGNRWQRAPALRPAWGDERPLLAVKEGLQLRFQERDQAFAEALARELPGLLEKFDPLVLPANQPLEIIIEPDDLHSPLIWDEQTHLVLNSPWLVPPGVLSGEEAVRLALVDALLHRTGPSSINPALPGGQRFAAAIHSVIAAHLVLSPEAHASLAETRRARLAERWYSPFFTDLTHPDEAEAQQQAGLAAEVVAYYVYRQEGLDGLVNLLVQLPSAAAWDDLFGAALRRPTIVLEQAAASEARTGPTATNPAASPEQSLILPLPLAGLITDAGDQPASRSSVCHFMPADAPAAPDIAGQAKQLTCFIDDATPGLSPLAGPLPIELPAQLMLYTSEGLSLPAACLPPGSLVEVEGSWLEAGQRLQVGQVKVQDITPVAMDPAPPDTVAYLLEGTRSEPVALYALSQAQGLHHLITLSESLEVSPLPIAPGGEPHFLVQRNLPGCKQPWFAHYEPAQGITGRWFAPGRPVQWVWRADRQDVMFFSPRENSLDYIIYETDGTMAPEQAGVSSGPLAFLGWNVEAGRLVSTASWFNETYIGLFDMASGNLTPMARPDYQPLQGRRLSPDGGWVAYLGGIRNILGPPDRLDVLHLIEETDMTLVQVEKGEGLWLPAWSHYLDQPSLSVLAGPVVGANLDRSRLLIASPEQPDHFTLVAQAAAGEQLASPVFCSDGSLLYRVEYNGRYRLEQQGPGLPARILLQFDRPLWPVACP